MPASKSIFKSLTVGLLVAIALNVSGCSTTQRLPPGVDLSEARDVTYYPNGELKTFHLLANKTIYDIPCSRGVIEFFEGGKIKRATLGKTYATADGTVYNPGTTIHWRENGEILFCVEPRDDQAVAPSQATNLITAFGNEVKNKFWIRARTFLKSAIFKDEVSVAMPDLYIQLAKLNSQIRESGASCEYSADENTVLKILDTAVRIKPSLKESIGKDPAFNFLNHRLLFRTWLGEKIETQEGLEKILPETSWTSFGMGREYDLNFESNHRYRIFYSLRRRSQSEVDPQDAGISSGVYVLKGRQVRLVPDDRTRKTVRLQIMIEGVTATLANREAVSKVGQRVGFQEKVELCGP